MDADLTLIAQRRVVDLQTDFSHTGWDPATAEVIAWNSALDPVEALARQWQDSPPHWAILSDPAFTEWGCAIARRDWQVFGICVLAGGNVTQPSLPPPNVTNPPEPSHSPPVELLPNTAMP